MCPQDQLNCGECNVDTLLELQSRGAVLRNVAGVPHVAKVARILEGDTGDLGVPVQGARTPGADV